MNAKVHRNVTFMLTVGLHAPTGERATMNESSPCALGIPESLQPIRQRDFQSKKETERETVI